MIDIFTSIYELSSLDFNLGRAKWEPNQRRSRRNSVPVWWKNARTHIMFRAKAYGRNQWLYLLRRLNASTLGREALKQMSVILLNITYVERARWDGSVHSQIRHGKEVEAQGISLVKAYHLYTW